MVQATIGNDHGKPVVGQDERVGLGRLACSRQHSARPPEPAGQVFRRPNCLERLGQAALHRQVNRSGLRGGVHRPVPVHILGE